MRKLTITVALLAGAALADYVKQASQPWVDTRIGSATNAVAEEISRRAAEAQRETAAATNALSSRVSSLSSTVNGKVSTNHVGDVKIVGRFAVGGFADGTSSIALGGQCNAEGDNSIALGTKVGTCEGVSGGAPYNPHKGAFAWQGHNGYSSQPYYYSHGQGTFNVNPVGGLRGFWIGETNLADHLAPYATTNDIAAYALPADETALAASAAFSNAVAAVGGSGGISDMSAITNSPEFISAVAVAISNALVNAVFFDPATSNLTYRTEE